MARAVAVCRRKVQMTPGVQSRNDTPGPPGWRTYSAKRHPEPNLGESGGVKG